MNMLLVILLTICLTPIGTLPVAALEEITERSAHLTVRGEAEIRVPADQLQLIVGVVTEAEKVEEALEKNSVRMREVVAALAKAGLTKQEYETGRLRIEPQWSPPPRQPAPDWRPQIVGYSTLNSLRIRTQKIASAGNLIAAAAAAGANEIGEIVFALADPRAHRAEAIRAATANAFADARALADAAGVRLAGIQSLALDQAAVYPISMAKDRMMSMEAATPPVEPGQITVRAGVTVNYLISDSR